MAPLIAAVVLAAGESARLGRSKQLIEQGGRSLLRHTVNCAVEGGCAPVVVVLGARAESLRGELEGTVARSVQNDGWREGVGSSVRTGVAAVQRCGSDVDAVLLLVCDQPCLTPRLVRDLQERFDGAAGRIVACEYAGTVGVPALFERSLFPELLALQGPAGARSLLHAQAQDVIRVPWPEGSQDVDRPEDLQRLS